MTRNNIKLLFLTLTLSQLLMVNFIFTGIAQAAQTYTGPENSIKRFLCAPTINNSGTTGNVVNNFKDSFTGSSTAAAAQNNSAAGDLYNCINRIYRFAIIFTASGAVLYIVIAGYFYMSSEGNGEMVEKAKSYVTSSITAIVILLVGYIILRALNPDLIQFHNIQPPSVKPASTTPPSTNGGGAFDGNTNTSGITPVPVADNQKNAAVAIQNLASSGKLLIASTGCDCANNCAINTIQTLASGNQPQTDGKDTCKVSTTSVNVNMLNALISAANSGIKFSIGSITGGHHSGPNDPHYQGKAVDVTPVPSSPTNQQKLVEKLLEGGANVVALECSGLYLTIPDKASPTDSQCINKSGYHIHAQWP